MELRQGEIGVLGVDFKLFLQQDLPNVLILEAFLL